MNEDPPSRDAVADMVSTALPHVLQSYLDLISTPPSDDLKSVQAHQAACKATLQHLEALLKLPIDPESTKGSQVDALADLLARAEAEVDMHDKTETSS